MGNNTLYDEELPDDYDGFEELDGNAEAEVARERETVRATGFRITAVILFLLAVGGLFLGLLSKWTSFFTPVVSAGTDGALNRSLIGVYIEIFKGLFTDGGIRPVTSLSFTDGLAAFLGAMHYYYFFVLAACIFVSLILTIIALMPERVKEGEIRPSRAERCAYGIALLTVLGYGGLFAIEYFFVPSTFLTINNFSTIVIPLADTVDMPSLLVSSLAAISLVLIAFAGAKKRDEKMSHIVIDFILFALACAAVFAIGYPTFRMIADLNSAFVSGTSLNIGIRIMILALVVICIFNLLVSLFRMRAKRGRIFDTSRFALQLIAAITLFSFYIALPAAAADAPDFGFLASLPAILLLSSSPTAFLFALFTMIVVMKRASIVVEEISKTDDSAMNTAMSVAAPAATNPYVSTEQETEVLPTNVSIFVERPAEQTDENKETGSYQETEEFIPAGQEPINESFTVSETVVDTIPEEQPKPAETESEKVVKSIVYVTNITNEPTETDNAERELGPIPYDVNETPISIADEQRLGRAKTEENANSADKDESDRDAESESYEPVRDVPKTERIREIYYYKDEFKDDREEETIKREEKKPAEPVKTDFMREMEALAKSAAQPAKTEKAEETSEQKPAFENTFTSVPKADAYQPKPAAYQPPPSPAPQPYFNGYQQQAQPQPQNQPSTYIDAQYTYDPFFITLTPQERNEFGDLFISNKFGAHSYLPLYVIGGENKEFFEKVFIYLGRYRGNISSDLLDKMYLYVSTKH